ncbi:unnamed protein product [Brassica oleracea var. botrytis]
MILALQGTPSLSANSSTASNKAFYLMIQTLLYHEFLSMYLVLS